VTGHSRDRVEAAATAIRDTLVPYIGAKFTAVVDGQIGWGATADELAASALAAAEECDRMAGVVRIYTNDNKTGRVIYDVLRMANESAYNTTLDAIARRILAALTAAGVGEQQGGPQT